jgi:trk system potassium uptake protein TrkA
VLTVAVLKELGIREIVARAQTERRKRVLEAVGATRVITVEAEMGKRLGRALVASHVLDHLEIGESIALIQWAADERVIGHTLRDLDLRNRYGLTLVAIKHCPSNARERVTVTPDPGHVFRAGDVLLLCGENAKLAAFTH